MKLWEDRLWRVLFLALSVAGLVGMDRLTHATRAAAELPRPALFQAPPDCDCDRGPRNGAAPRLEVIEEPRPRR